MIFSLGFFGVLYLFIPWTYKPDNDHLNTYICPSVVCVINRQNIILKYGMRGHFRYNLPLQGELTELHDFIRNEYNLKNHNEYTYKARKKQHIAWKGFQNKHATYCLERNMNYSDSRTDPNETDHYNIHHSRPVPLPRSALSMPDLHTSSYTFFNHATYC